MKDVIKCLCELRQINQCLLETNLHDTTKDRRLKKPLSPSTVYLRVPQLRLFSLTGKIETTFSSRMMGEEVEPVNK